jgi:hypothetical protein
MDVVLVSLVSACTAFVSATVGPLVSFAVAARQTRATLISSNRERWSEALRDGLADYISLCQGVAALEEAKPVAPIAAIRDDPELACLVERIARARGLVLLMLNPDDPENRELCRAIERTYRALSEGAVGPGALRSDIEVITNEGRAVLRNEWARVKRQE